MKLLKEMFLGTALVLACDSGAAEPASLSTQQQKASYGVGMNVGKRFKHDLIDLDTEAFMRGFKDALSDAKPAVTEEELSEAMAALRDSVEKKAVETAARNKKEGDEFLAKNKTAPGVKTTESGLQYTVLKEGAGPVPKPTDLVKVHYRGTFLDGTEFDSSYKRGEPAVFPANQVIKGWVEALGMMKTGAKWKLFIPAELAYGEASQPPIPPNSLLIFEVELLEIDNSAKPSGS